MFGAHLKSLREAAGLTQRELAGRVGVTDSMISKLESGDRDPTVRMLRDLALALEVPSYSLVAVAMSCLDQGAADPRLVTITQEYAHLTESLVRVVNRRSI